MTAEWLDRGVLEVIVADPEKGTIAMLGGPPELELGIPLTQSNVFPELSSE